MSETLLLQKAVFPESKDKENSELDLAMCKDVAFVETMDLSGPRLILKFDDRFSIVRNIMGVSIGSVIRCSLSTAAFDVTPLIFEADFRIMSMPVDGDVVTLNMLHEPVAKLKDPSKTARLFTRERYSSVNAIIKAIAPGFVAYDFDLFPLRNDYHLLPGERPSLLLRQIERETGAILFAFRGTLKLLRLSRLYGGTTNVTFCYLEPEAAYQIITYRHLNAENLITDRIRRKYIGFNLIDGLIESTTNTESPVEWSQYDNTQTMNNIGKFPMPVLDMVTFGTGGLGPGLPINFRWNLELEYGDLAIDESLPVMAVIGNVSHYTSGAMNYFCRLKAVVPA